MKKAVILLMAAVLVAGCVGQVTPSIGKGLEIKSFTSDTEEQFSGRNIRLFLEIENAGESLIDANKTLIYLSGPIGTGLLQWEMVEGSQATALKRDLNPYDPLRDIPAGRASVKWTIKAPQLDPGQRKKDSFTARAYYDYETKIIGEVVAYSEAEAEALRERGEPLEKSSFTTTAGPIGASVEVKPDPVVVVDESGELMTLLITIENVGGGTLYKRGVITAETTQPSLSYDDLNRIELTLDAGSLNESIEGECSGEHELIGGKPTTISCDIKVPMPAAKATYPMKISLKYGYYIDEPITLTAVGRR